MRVIPTRVHGIVDYLTAFTLLALPRLLGWSDRMSELLTALAVITVAYSLLTRYELGALRIVPMKAHLGLDLGSGLLLLALALLLSGEPRDTRAGLAAIGAFGIGASVFTRTIAFAASSVEPTRSAYSRRPAVRQGAPGSK